MTHAESDGVGEMLEGAHRSTLTAVHRWLELFNRRTTDRAAIAARVADRDTRHDLAHRQVVEELTHLGQPQAAPGDSVDSGPSAGRFTDEERDRAHLMDVLLADRGPGPESNLDTTAERHTAILQQWRSARDRREQRGDEAFDEQYWRRWAVMEATGAQLELAEERANAAMAQPPGQRTGQAYRQRLANELGDVVCEDARTRHTARDKAAARAVLNDPADRTHAAADAHAALAAENDVAELADQLRHDSHEERVARAQRLGAEGFEPDITQAAMINDLTYGAPAAASAPRRRPRPARPGSPRIRGTVRQRGALGR